MIAGCPLKRGFSTSASRDAAKATRSVLQKPQLTRAALIVSPQPGQILVSSFIGAFLADLSSRVRLHVFFAAAATTLISSLACLLWPDSRNRISGGFTARP